MILDPVIHGVAADHLHLRHFAADVGLEDGVDVGEKEVFAVLVGVGDLGREALEDVQLGVEGVGLVEVLHVGAAPEEAFAGNVLDALGIDVAAGQDGFFFGAEVFADDANDADVSKVAGGEGEVGGGAAEAAVATTGGGFDGVKGDAADNENGHEVRSSGIAFVTSSDICR